MDERLVIPKNLRTIIIRFLHYGHTGRDSMMATVSSVWGQATQGSRIPRTNMQTMPTTGKNIKPLLRQNQV